MLFTKEWWALERMVKALKVIQARSLFIVFFFNHMNASSIMLQYLMISMRHIYIFHIAFIHHLTEYATLALHTQEMELRSPLEYDGRVTDVWRELCSCIPSPTPSPSSLTPPPSNRAFITSLPGMGSIAAQSMPTWFCVSASNGLHACSFL